MGAQYFDGSFVAVQHCAGPVGSASLSVMTGIPTAGLSASALTLIVMEETVIRTVYTKANLDFRKNQNINKTGETQTNSFFVNGNIINEISRSLPVGRLRGVFAFDYILFGRILALDIPEINVQNFYVSQFNAFKRIWVFRQVPSRNNIITHHDFNGGKSSRVGINCVDI